MPNTIVLQSKGGKSEEGTTSGAFKPGHLLALGNGTLAKAGAAAKRILVATENVLDSGGTVDTEYASGTRCFYHIPVSGDVVQLRASSATTFNNGTELEAAAAGQVVAQSSATALAVAEAVDAQNGGADSQTTAAADDLIRCRVL